MLLVKSNVLKNSDKSSPRQLLCCLALFPSISNAQTETAISTSYVSVFLSLLLIVVIIFMLAFIMRRFNVTQTGSTQMKVVASMMMGGRERVLVIQVGDEQHLIGITAQNINHLAKLESQLEPQGNEVNFKDKLAELMHPRSVKQDPKSKSVDS